MARYGRDFRGRGRYGRDEIPHDPSIDYGYRRGGFMGSRMGGVDNRGGAAGRMGGTWSGGGGQWTAYGHSEMGVTLGNRGGMGGGGMARGGMSGGGGGARGPRARRGPISGRSMRYDVGYGMGNDREWY